MPLSPLGIKKASSHDLIEETETLENDEKRKSRGSFTIISAAEGAMNTIKRFSQKTTVDDENPKNNNNNNDSNIIKYQMIYFVAGIMLIAIILSWWLNGTLKNLV